MIYRRIESPLGQIILAGDGTALTGLYFDGQRYFGAVPTEWEERADNELLQAAEVQLQAYLAGQRQQFDLPLRATGTPFQREVWQELSRLGYGQTITYGELAERIGRPAAVRAAGTAIGRNPLCIVVPCHRVLASGGGLGGYVAGLDFKTHLLRLEGALR